MKIMKILCTNKKNDKNIMKNIKYKSKYIKIFKINNKL